MMMIKFIVNLIKIYLKKEQQKKNEFQTQIVFEPYILDEKKFSLPIATFTTI